MFSRINKPYDDHKQSVCKWNDALQYNNKPGKFQMKSNADTTALPQTLQKLFLHYHKFNKRFETIHEIEDPYGRTTEISHDIETDKRAAVRNYTALEEGQQHDVLQNMQNFRRLGEEQGLCKLIAFTKKEEGGIILAAFQYNDFSIEELLLSRQYEKERYELYHLILKEMIDIISTVNTAGITIQDLIPSCILLQSSGPLFHLKFLFDQREKKYSKIQQGTKVFASPEKMMTVMKEMRDYESVALEEAVFELGLLLLDFMYEFQMRASLAQKDIIFAKDQPLQRHNLSSKSYLIFKQDRVELNHNIVAQKMDFLKSLGVPYITKLALLIKRMTNSIDQRISFEHLYEEAQNFHQLMEEAIKNNVSRQSIEQNTYPPLTPPKESLTVDNQASENITKKQDPYGLEYNTGAAKNVISLTTIATPHYTSTTDRFTKHLEPISDAKVVEIIIPREKLLSKARKCTFLLPKFEDFISKLQQKAGIIKKEYLDGSIYYGCLNASNKREGSGIYIYNTNDIYFGIWKDNTLVDGNYLFQNGESFQGLVKNGKQGFGRYCYANGNIYDGQWRDDVKSGTGRMKYPNGDIYDGMWSKGKKNGQGKYVYHNGVNYVGNFVDGKKNGLGVITFPNGTKIEAYWNQTHIEGPGKVFYSNGNYFQGNYHLSEKEGKGLYRWEEAQYEGEFKKDLMQGHACISFSDKEYYNGRIKNGKRDGRGFYQYSNGDSFEGDWRNDQKVLGHYKFHEGGSFEGRFKQNELSYGTMLYANCESYEGEFCNGQRHGIGIYKGAKGEVLYQGRWQADQFIAPH